MLFYNSFNLVQYPIPMNNSHILFPDWTLNALSKSFSDFSSPYDLRELVGSIENLPLQSAIAMHIIEISVNPYADVAQLAKIIKLDPILASQVIRWANSPLYYHANKVESIEEAILLLGYIVVLNLALSLSSLNALHIPVQGLLGAQNILIQGNLSAFIMQELNKKLPAGIRQKPGTIYLVALIHNIGFHLFAHYFSSSFDFLNKVVEHNPYLEVFQVEKFLYNVDHALIGSILMRHWKMPEVLVDVVQQHHNPNYRGNHYQMNLLTYISDTLIGEMGLGDAQNQICPDTCYAELGLDPEVGKEILQIAAKKLDDVTALVNSILNYG